jgi:predicted ribosomally synthesized peptide with SipW-like signal peptide
MRNRQATNKGTDDRSRDYRKIVLSIALLLAAAGALIGGAFATFTDTVTAGPQAISSGTVKLVVGPVNDAGTAATNIAAGDWVLREADLNSTGATLADKEITLKFSAPVTSSLLDTDPTYGLQVSIQACSSAWTRVVVGSPPPAFTYTCGAGATTVNINGSATASVSALETTAGALTPLNSLTGGKDFLVFKLELPSGAPGDLSKHEPACSGVAGGTVTTEDLQGCSSALTYTFQATQRNAIAQ